MRTEKAPKTVDYPVQFTTRKVQGAQDVVLTTPDSLAAWIRVYLALAVHGVRSEEVTTKITLHLDRFRLFVDAAYGHDRLSTVLKRDVVAWRDQLILEGLAAATVNNHLASLSTCTSWVSAQAPRAFALGDPAKGIGELGLPPLEPRALSADQVVSLKNVCDRLPRLHQKRGRRWATREGGIPLRARSRPWRDRAIVFVLLSTGLRREELVRLDFDQVEPRTPQGLRDARRGRITRVQGKGNTERTVFLSQDARLALAEYLEKERPGDTDDETIALFVSARGIPARSDDGRLSVRAINQLLDQIGRWHDAEVRDPARRISPLRPHDLRHTFAFQLARVTGADAYELERRLGHRSQRYIQRYTNPPEPVAAGYVEKF
jgi:integrase